MKFRLFFLFMIIMLMSSSTTAQAWVFLYVPAEVSGSISDAITGGKGDFCVGENVRVGDTFRLSDGSLGKVISLSGTSLRCNNQDFPIRAEIEKSYKSRPVPVYIPKATVELPDGWATAGLTPKLKEDGFYLYAINKTIDAGLLMSGTERKLIADMSVYAKTRRTNQADRLIDAKSSEIEQVQINGKAAWQFEVSGKQKSGRNITYYYAIVDGGAEIVVIGFFVHTAAYPEHKAALQNIAYSIMWKDTALQPTGKIFDNTNSTIQP